MATYNDPMENSATLRLVVNQSSQSVEDNTSTDSWSLTLLCTNGLSNTGFPKPWSVSIGDSDYDGTFTFDFRSSTSKLIASGSTVVEHDEDGTKTISVTAEVDASPVSIGAGAISDDFTQTRIPRGPKVEVDGEWTNSVAHVEVDGAWEVCLVYAEVDGAWELVA